MRGWFNKTIQEQAAKMRGEIPAKPRKRTFGYKRAQPASCYCNACQKCRQRACMARLREARKEHSLAVAIEITRLDTLQQGQRIQNANTVFAGKWHA